MGVFSLIYDQASESGFTFSAHQGPVIFVLSMADPGLGGAGVW